MTRRRSRRRSSGLYTPATTIRHAALRVDQRPVGSDSVVPGATDITLLQFDAVAGRQDMRLTQLQLRAASGDLTNLSNARLLLDGNNDGIFESEISQGRLTRNTLRFVIRDTTLRDGTLYGLKVVADVRQSARVGSSIALEFDTTVDSAVQGVGKYDGRDVSGVVFNSALCTLESICWVRINTRNAAIFTIEELGEIEIEE